mgnify:CR=1 FL=1
MVEFLCFFAGLLLGGCIAGVLLCCMQINRIRCYEQTIQKLKEEMQNKS